MGEPAPEEGADNSIDVTINVTNVEEMGTVTLDSDQPMLGTALTASVTDPDVADQGTVMWQWASSATMAGPFTEISGATTDASYTPADADVGNYLQATASYDDGVGVADTAMRACTSRPRPPTTTERAPARWRWRYRTTW
jgi:hypothetical protein